MLHTSQHRLCGLTTAAAAINRNACLKSLQMPAGLGPSRYSRLCMSRTVGRASPRRIHVRAAAGEDTEERREPSKDASALDTRLAPVIQDVEERDADLQQEVLLEPRRSGLLQPLLNRVGRLQTPVVAMLAAAGLLGTGYDASGPAGIIEALLVLTAIVAFHELGHFTAARAQGIHVTKFAIGFGPKLFAVKRGAVEYSLRAIPLGGFVAFPDDDPDSKIPKDDPDLLRNRPVGQRMLVISAGIIFNIILAYSILLAQVTTVGTPSMDFQPGVKIPEVLRASAGQRAGLQAGDIVLGLNGQPLTPSPYSVARAVAFIRDNPGREVTLTVQRGDQKPFPLSVTPDLAAKDNGGVIGVKLGANATIVRSYADGPVAALKQAGSEFTRLGSQILDGLKQIFTNFGAVSDKISGPVSIVTVGADVARTDISGLFQFGALINLNLAAVNALPLPALDGGYFALLLVEAIRGKKLNQAVEQTIMASGVLLLTGAGVFLILRDITNLAG